MILKFQHAQKKLLHEKPTVSTPLRSFHRSWKRPWLSYCLTIQSVYISL